jgi:hypothetical protein
MLEVAEGRSACRATVLFKASSSAGGAGDFDDGIGMGGTFEMGPGLGREVGLARAADAGGVPEPIELTDNWDGTYSAIVDCEPGCTPALVATYRDETGAEAYVALGASPGTTLRVVVTLLEVRYETSAQSSAPVPSSAAVIAAPNASYPRSAGRMINLDESCPGGATLPQVVFDGHVEDGAMMLLALGDDSLDFFGAFDDTSTADVQLLPLTLGEIEVCSSGSLRAPWSARYAVDVRRIGATVEPASGDDDGRVASSPPPGARVSAHG